MVKSFIYLSINVSSNGNFFHTQKYLSEQASKALYSLSNLFYEKSMSAEDKIKLFDSLVIPILNYGSEVWGFRKSPDVEKVHLKFL